MEDFNEDYYERGIETGVSCYSNYRWMPEMTIPLAYHLVRHLGVRDSDSVLDYGCAKGYLVKALRLLGFNAWGCDVSTYALSHSPEDTREYLFKASHLPFFADRKFNWSIAKDVLEHVNPDDLQSILSGLRRTSEQAFVVVPLGHDGRFVIEAYELDKTHLIREDLKWWVNQLTLAGFRVESAEFRAPGIKDNWSQFPKGNGFIRVK